MARIDEIDLYLRTSSPDKDENKSVIELKNHQRSLEAFYMRIYIERVK